MIKKAGYSCRRAKIDHLNLQKRYIKYTYSESTLDGLFKTLILSLEMTKFKASRWYRMVSTASRAKIEVKFTGQFLENGWTKKNPLSTVCSNAWDTHHIKKWARSVQSSRSYSNYKVPYQMTKKARWPPFRAKIDNLNYIKYHIEYIWGYSPLTEDSKTLTFVGQIRFFVVPKFGSPRVARKFDFFQI